MNGTSSCEFLHVSVTSNFQEDRNLFAPRPKSPPPKATPPSPVHPSPISVSSIDVHGMAVHIGHTCICILC